MQEKSTLKQLHLPAKKGCGFDLFTDNPNNPTQYYLYFGVTLLDNAPNDKKHVLYKFLCARLALCGYKLEGLAKTFGYSRKTISNWKSALSSGEIKSILHAFGLNRYCKITPDIQEYIKTRYKQLRLDNESSYSKIILSEVQEYFNLPLSSSGIRNYFRIADKELFENEPEAYARIFPNTKAITSTCAKTEVILTHNTKYNDVFSEQKPVILENITKTDSMKNEAINHNENKNSSVAKIDDSDLKPQHSTSHNEAEKTSQKEIKSCYKNTLPLSGKAAPQVKTFFHGLGIFLLLIH